LDTITTGTLLIILGCLILGSAFFSSAETGMTSLNRYRLRHLIKHNHRGAKLANALLERPDRFFGVVLIGNTFINSAASAITAIIGLRLGGDTGLAIATFCASMIVLVFGEVTPKTIAALHPERIAFPASYILTPMLKALYPLVWFTNHLSNGLLKLFRINTQSNHNDQLTADELRTVVHESGKMLSPRYRGMLLNILDLGHMTVQDIMVPRAQVLGINIDDSDTETATLLQNTDFTRIPVYQGELNNVLGIFHMRRIGQLVDDKNREDDLRQFIIANMREPYFVPESTPLNVQLLNFQKEKRRIALVVDEYGDVQGVVTLEDILEEIVGEFTSNIGDIGGDIQQLPDGYVQLDCSANIRDINQMLSWDLPITPNGARTLNGLIIDHLGAIPTSNICFQIGCYRFETVTIAENRIQSVIAIDCQ
jgi:Mg2+/Co2+ transporter CorB